MIHEKALRKWKSFLQSFFVRIKFPVRHGEMGANSTGNYGRKVSCPAWDYGASTQQETIGERFPVRHGAMVHQLNRKRLADSFLSGMRLWCINSTGNYWRTVSCSACEQWEPPQQETICEKFPVRRVSNGSHHNRKLLVGCGIEIRKVL